MLPALVQRLSRLCLIIGILLSASACTSLTDVAKFSQLSSETAQYTKLIDFTESSYERLKGAHLDQKNLAIEKLTNDAFTKTKPDLEKIHDAVAGYMTILGKLADKDVPSTLDKPLDGLSKGITAGAKAYGFTINQSHLDAFTAIAKIVSSWAISAASQRELTKLLEPEVVNPVQTLIAAMRDIGVELKKQLQDEIKQTVGALALYYKIAERRSSEPLAVTLAEENIAIGRTSLQQKLKEFEVFDTAMGKISAGLTQLSANRSHLGDEERVKLAKKLWTDLYEVYTQLKKFD